MNPNARELDDALRSEALNGTSRAYCRLYVSADGGSDRPETPGAARCWLLPGHQGACQPAPFHTGNSRRGESRWHLSVDRGGQDVSVVMVEHTPAGPRLHPSSRPYRVMAPLLPAYADEPADPAYYAQTLARLSRRPVRSGSLLSNVLALGERLTARDLACERACPSTLLALLPEPPES